MFSRSWSVGGGTGQNAFSTNLTIEGDFNGVVHNVDDELCVPIGMKINVTSEYSQYAGYMNSLKCKTSFTQSNRENAIVGLSIEHFGSYLYQNPEGGLVGVNIVKRDNGDFNPGYINMGGIGGQNAFTMNSDYIYPTNCAYMDINTGQTGTGADSYSLTNGSSLAGAANGCCNIRNQAYGNWARKISITWVCHIPIFDTDAHLLQYIATDGQVAEGLLNGEQPIIPDDYKYFMQNEYTLFRDRGLSTQTGESFFYNVRIKPVGNDRMCLVNTAYSEGQAKVYKLFGNAPEVVYQNTSYGWAEYDGDIFEARFVRTEGTYGTRDAIPRLWYTNLYFFDGPDSETWARHYIETGDPTGATNLKEVARATGQKIPGKIGDPTTVTPNGTPSFTMSSGGRILGLTSGQANKFFADIFASGNVQDLLDGTQLFGANQLNSIRGFHYLPLDIEEICTCGSTSTTFLGSYEYTFDSAVKWVTNNNKMINCGAAAFPETYGDYRDYEPYCKLAVMLPYCGTHELKISNYINKTITIKYAVDVTTGACTAYIFADGIIIDSFDGSMQFNRPVTGNDQQRQASAVFEGLMKTGTAAVGTVGQVAAGVSGGAAIGEGTGNFAAQTAGSIAGGMLNGGGGALGTIGKAANTLQAAIDNPIATRGSYGGILGLFGVQSPYFIFAWLRTVEPNNELSVVGKPSGTGQAVGAFGGFLQTSAFQLAAGFTGTDKEAEEIYNIVSNGIYL